MAGERPCKDLLHEGQYWKAKAKEECPTQRPLFSSTARMLEPSSTSARLRSGAVHNHVTRYQPTPKEQAQRKKEALAERVEKQSRVRIWTPSARSCRMFSCGLTWRWLRSTTSDVWGTTITVVSARCTDGKRRRAKRHGALKPWITRRSRRQQCKP